MLEFLSHPFVQRAIIAIFLTSLAAALVGTFMVFRGLSFLVSGVAHAALGGAALGIFLETSGLAPFIDPLLGALLFGILVALIAGVAGETGISARMEIAIGVSFAFAMSIAVFFMFYIPPERVPQIWGFLIGDLLLLTEKDILLLFTACFALSIIVLLFHREFIYVSFDMEALIAQGINAKVYHYLMLITMAIAIIVATKAIGAILVYAILVAPAAVAAEWGRSVGQVILLVFILALFSQVIGLVSSFQWNLSPSAMAGIVAATIYLITLAKKKAE
ncbi:MAG: ABC transporter permease [Candidatus Methanomethylicota archaeon]|uniref:ABC transporter permease n=1 Tax=Thermoproteota archaeon TaxID=2056631 RepID=A0A497F2R1_9CREN|nr:MAG: ABC transporter permease [Candidatus Verstraetearchaeota archaeon]RLE53589.1 MAG: ABC transporter permease [Candidatus Verstraetearchaeota archaeon]